MWHRIIVILFVYTMMWFICLSPWDRSLFFNPYIIFCYLGIIGLVALRVRGNILLDRKQAAEDRKRRLLATIDALEQEVANMQPAETGIIGSGMESVRERIAEERIRESRRNYSSE